MAPGLWVKKPCAVRFREQGTPEQVFSPTRGHTLGPSAAGSKIRHPDQGSALDARWEQLQEAPLLRRQAAGGLRRLLRLLVDYNGSLCKRTADSRLA
ncbi:hypothetical protein H920_10919 [Fukomys damarensis]|uniref:Uncharacterized protein n=1 Tax=Fukomys damarensis TaxID=885580 RepID=A0A091D9B9_FUKDA|nr:hypothetical protein H920_10919 [Fukomys damarensis]